MSEEGKLEVCRAFRNKGKCRYGCVFASSHAKLFLQAVAVNTSTPKVKLSSIPPVAPVLTFVIMGNARLVTGADSNMVRLILDQMDHSHANV